jgi:hypothetical protein
VADIYLGFLMKPKEEKKENETRAESEKKTISLSAEQLKSYAGDYRSPELGVTYRLGIVDGRLQVVALKDGAGTLRTTNLPLKPFAATEPDEFSTEKSSVTIHFQRDANQSVKGFTLDAGRTRGLIFSREAAAR